MIYSYQMQNSELGYTLSIWIYTVMREYVLELCDGIIIMMCDMSITLG